MAIAVETEAKWRAFCGAIGRLELAADERFRDLEARRRHEDALDAIVSEWTCERDAGEAAEMLQRRAVPAHAVENSAGILGDPQLLHRRHFLEIEDAHHGTTFVESSRFRLSRTPAVIRGPAPTLGGDNHEVLTAILGYDDARIAELVAAGALG